MTAVDREREPEAPARKLCRRDAVAAGCLAGMALGAAACATGEVAGGGAAAAPATAATHTPVGLQTTPPAPAVLAPVASVPVGGGTVFPAHRVVVTQPRAGTFVGFSATCTHEGCLVSQVRNGTIDCPCHGSRFSITDGSVVRGPALHTLHRRAIQVDGSTILLDA